MVKKISVKTLFYVFSTLCLVQAVHSQAQTDSVSAKISTGVLIASKDYLPFYLVYNRWGGVNDEQRFFFQGSIEYDNKLNKNWTFQSSFSFRNKVITELFAEIKRQNISFYVGRKGQVLGGIPNNQLTTGSMAMSANAVPVPQIGLDIDYFDLPLTHGYFKIKGGMSIGQFEKDRYISNTLLHQKYFGVILDLKELIGLRIYSSLIHSVQYGGTSPQGEKQPSSFKDFLRLFVGQGIPNPDPMGGTAAEFNAIGNHLGVSEWTIEKQFGESMLRLNYQKPFEDLGSIQYISLTDYLIGLEFTTPKNSFLSKVYLEYIQTKWQSGPGLPDATEDVMTAEDNYGYRYGGRDDFYNNYLYQSGWTYGGNIISNPLFLTYSRAINFLGTFPNYQNEIINNRIRSYHIGMSFVPTDKFSIRTMFTYTENYGTYAGLYEGRFQWEGVILDSDFDYVFRNGKNQFYSLIEGQFETVLLKQPAKIKGLLAFDTGELYTNSGIELAVEFMLKTY